jgi:hypothetical protein
MFWVARGLWLDPLTARDRIGSADGSGIALGLRNHLIAPHHSVSDKPSLRVSRVRYYCHCENELTSQTLVACEEVD